MPNLVKMIGESGFPHVDELIHVFIGGSELHGAKVKGTDDLDIYGVYVEPPELVLGLEGLPHFVWSTAGDERKNGPDDIDVTLYSLRKWAVLACKGNPTALHFLFVDGQLNDPIWAKVRANRQLFLSRLCAKHFLGFANDQLRRITGQKGRGKKGQRPDFEVRYGYDVKAAMHALRLLYECEEIVTHGTITLPRPERELLIRVRTGKYSIEKVVTMAEKMFVQCETAAQNTRLPERINRLAVSKLLAECYLQAWN